MARSSVDDLKAQLLQAEGTAAAIRMELVAMDALITVLKQDIRREVITARRGERQKAAAETLADEPSSPSASSTSSSDSLTLQPPLPRLCGGRSRLGDCTNSATGCGRAACRRSSAETCGAKGGEHGSGRARCPPAGRKE